MPPALSESPLISEDSDSEDEQTHAVPMDFSTHPASAQHGPDAGLSDDDDMPSLHTVSDSSDDEPSFESAWETESDEDSEEEGEGDEEEDDDDDFSMSDGEGDNAPAPPRPHSPSPRETPLGPIRLELDQEIDVLRSLTGRDGTAPQVRTFVTQFSKAGSLNTVCRLHSRRCNRLREVWSRDSGTPQIPSPYPRSSVS